MSEEGIESINKEKIDLDVIADIIDKLKEAKTAVLKQSFNNIKKYGIKPVNNMERYKLEINQPRLKTGTLIDKMLGGGLPPTKSMLLYGAPATGKSEITTTMAATCSDVIVYIDAENSFSFPRLKQICDEREIDFQMVMDKLILYQPVDWIELMFLLYDLPSPADVGKIELIVLDSVTKHFRGLEFAGRGELSIKQPMIREIPLHLKYIAKDYNCAFILTTQVYQKPVTQSYLPEWSSYQAVGGVGLEHQTTYNLLLRHGSNPVIQIARLTDADDVPLSEEPFVITAAGVEELPDSKKAEEMIKKAEKYQKKNESCLEDSKKEKKEKVEDAIAETSTSTQ
jgi:RecA/RadA recombinase